MENDIVGSLDILHELLGELEFRLDEARIEKVGLRPPIDDRISSAEVHKHVSNEYNYRERRRLREDWEDAEFNHDWIRTDPGLFVRDFSDPGSARIDTLESTLRIVKVVCHGDTLEIEADLESLLQRLRELGRIYGSEWYGLAEGVAATEHLKNAIDHDQGYSPPSILVPSLVSEVSDELLIALAADPSLLTAVDSRAFELIVAAIFRRFGMDVQLTKKTRDGGIDIIAFEDTKYTRNHYIVECKHYRQDHKVGLAIVQRLYGIKIAQKATKAFLVTSSSFSRDALKFARQHTWEIDLKQHSDVLSWLRQFWGGR
jgi:hypothetical protein